MEWFASLLVKPLVVHIIGMLVFSPLLVSEAGFIDTSDERVVESLIYLMCTCMDDIHDKPFDVKYEAVHALFSLLLVGRPRNTVEYDTQVMRNSSCTTYTRALKQSF